MALTKTQTTELTKKFGKDEKDSGSTKVQIALLTQQINQLTEHLKVHIHDGSSRKGLFVLVGKRKGLLNYLKTHDEKGYVELIKELKIRK